MAFNPDKCEVIRITKIQDPIIFDYQLHGITLQITKNAKYLGLNISDDLTWCRHINQAAAKGNNTLKVIKRNVQTHNSKIKETAYKNYVRISLPPYIAPLVRNRFTIPFSRINAHTYSYFPRTARLWNNLPLIWSANPDLEPFRAGLALHFQ